MSGKKLSAMQHKVYVQWLGIPEKACPPNHYTLLGLPLFEASTNKIKMAARARRDQVVAAANANEQNEAKALVRSLAAAQSELLSETEKGVYDKKLRFSLEDANDSTSTPSRASVSTSQGGTATATAVAGNRTTTRKESPRSGSQPSSDSVESIRVDEANSDEWRRESNKEKSPVALKLALAGSALMNVVLLGALVSSLISDADRDASASKAEPAASPRTVQSEVAAPVHSPSLDPAETTPETTDNIGPVDSVADVTPEESSDIEVPVEPEEKPIYSLRDPFGDLKPEFALPEMPINFTEPSTSTAAGKIHLRDFAKLSLALDSSAADLADRYEFALEDDAQIETNSRRWRVMLRPKGNETGAVSRVGQFFVDENQQFRFLWEMSGELPLAPQLRNCLLKLAHGSDSHYMQLRSVVHAKLELTDLSGGSKTLPFQLPSPPANAKLALRVVMHPAGHTRRGAKYGSQENFDVRGYASSKTRYPPILAQVADTQSELIRLNASQDIPVDEKDMVRVGMTLKSEGSNGDLSVGITPRIRLGMEKRSRYSSKSIEELRDDLNLQRRRISDDMKAYGNAIAQINREMPRLAKLNQDYQRLIRLAKSNQSRAGQYTTQIANVNAKIGPIQLAVNKNQKLAGIKAKSIPKSYDALADRLRILREAGRVHNSGELEYRIVGIADSGEIVLVSADGLPDAERVPFVMPPFKMQGQWFSFDSGLTYAFQGEGRQGPAVVRHTFKRKPPPRNGTWSLNRQAARVNIGAVEEKYRVHEEIMLQSETTTLYRLF